MSEDNFEKGIVAKEMESGSDAKVPSPTYDQEVSDGSAIPRMVREPEFLRRMDLGERMALEKRLKRKIDLRLMPMIVIMYIMNYLDRNNIAAAKLAGIKEDLNLKGVEFQTSVSILFVGYLLMQVPSNLLLNKLGKPSLYLPTCMVIWGLISGLTAVCQNYGGLIACRFMLGFVEAAYFPGCLYYLSCWYTRQELGLRTAIFYSGALISGAFSGLIAAGVKAHMDGSRGMRAWRWLFIIEGTATVVIAFGAYFILPDFPRTTTWLTEEEQQLAIWRLEEDVGEDDWVSSGSQSFLEGAKLAFSDIKTYVLLFLLFGIVASGSVTNFFPTVVGTLTKNNVKALLLTAPPYCLAVIATFLNSWHADRTGERYFHIVVPLCFAIVAFILAAATTSIGPRYLAMMVMVPGVYSGFVVALAWISNSLPRPPAKRAAALALINAVSNTSSIYASYMYSDSDAPRYVTAMSVNCAMCVMGIIAATILRIILVRLNKKLDMGIFVEGAINAVPTEAGQKGFRFKI